MSEHLLAIPFKPAHAADLRLRPGAALALAGLAPLQELARAYHAAGPALSVLAGGEVLACGGVVRFWPGVGECWCWAGVGVDAHPVVFARLAVGVLDELTRAHGFHRLQAHVREDDTRANRFALFLGFLLEGRCPGFGPAQPGSPFDPGQSGPATYNLYGRYRTWKE